MTLINNSSNEGDLVIDPFCGSGSTLVAAKSALRRFAGCDIQPDAIELTRKRLDDTWVKGEPLKASDL